MSGRYPMRYRGHSIDWNWDLAGDGVQRKYWRIYAERKDGLWEEVGTAHTLKAARELVRGFTGVNK